MMFSNTFEYLSQDIRNFDLTKRERFPFHAEYKVLHLQGKRLCVDSKFRRLAALNHKLACSVAIKFCYCTEKIKEVLAVLPIETGDEARIDEDNLWDVPLFV